MTVTETATTGKHRPISIQFEGQAAVVHCYTEWPLWPLEQLDCFC